jgi:hypothetical protein
MARFQIDTALGDPSCGGRSGWLNRPQTERCWPQVAAWRILGPTTSAVTARVTRRIEQEGAEHTETLVNSPLFSPLSPVVELFLRQKPMLGRAQRGVRKGPFQGLVSAFSLY